MNIEICQVKLGEQGWKERYYSDKFMANTPEEVDEIRKSVVRILFKHQFLLFFDTGQNIHVIICRLKSSQKDFAG